MERAMTINDKKQRVLEALENGAEILANFKGEPDSTKQEEWEACYAMLFKQLNGAVEVTRHQDAEIKRLRETINNLTEIRVNPPITIKDAHGLDVHIRKLLSKRGHIKRHDIQAALDNWDKRSKQALAETANLTPPKGE